MTRLSDISSGEVDGEPRSSSRPISRGPINSFWVPIDYSSHSHSSTLSSRNLQTVLNTIRYTHRTTTISTGTTDTRHPLLRRNHSVEATPTIRRQEERKQARLIGCGGCCSCLL